MICPVLCFTCGKRIDYLYEKFQEEMSKNESKTTKQILDNLKIKRICCRTVIISTVDISAYLPYA